ncbi:MAG: thymidine phosphorylase [Ruminococcaceae bacterium]|nr:thymidine phosphorylase [Oscillospiraceae bacterium]
MYDVIAKKRDGRVLSDAEIRAVIDGYTAGRIPDYQVSAWLMAIYLRGMNEAETASLTDAMLHSGDIVDLSAFGHLSADKHSTGGVGDKTTFIVAPLAAVLGCKTAKMSGRGLGHTGGTIDKLEAIPGYRVSLSEEEFRTQVRRIGVSVIGATGDIAPADKLLYALRDVTATVDSLPLIASSIMSKKLAAGTSSIVLDVTVGSGAFMKTTSDARALAQAMVDIGVRAGKNITAVLTDMDQPLGRTIGNALELEEVISFLQGDDNGLDDLREVSLTLAAHMAANVHGITPDEAYRQAYDAWKSGAAYEKFMEWITAQGGDPAWITDAAARQTAPVSETVCCAVDGYLAYADAEMIGLAAMQLGAGRQTKDDRIDMLAGIRMCRKVGEPVRRGEPLAVLYTSDPTRLSAAGERFLSALRISQEKPDAHPHILGVVCGSETAG